MCFIAILLKLQLLKECRFRKLLPFTILHILAKLLYYFINKVLRVIMFPSSLIFHIAQNAFPLFSLHSIANFKIVSVKTLYL